MTTAEATGDQVGVGEDGGEARLMTHSYDGIREYDNPLPGWWRAVFYGTIIFAGFYALYFHVVGWGSTPDERYRAALAVYDEGRERRERADLANISEEALAQKANDGKVVAQGAAVFASRCASCHGPEAAGLIGPNLTDLSQIHGDSRMDIYRTVRGGVPGTAMPPWGEQLGPADVVAATAFVITLRGKSLPGKRAEGLPVKAFAP